MDICNRRTWWKWKFWKVLRKEMQKNNPTEFRVENVIKLKDNQLYVNWKDYDNLFNRLTDKKDIVI